MTTAMYGPVLSVVVSCASFVAFTVASFTLGPIYIWGTLIGAFTGVLSAIWYYVMYEQVADGEARERDKLRAHEIRQLEANV
jgi:amino acid transporter